jgi:hypothetical protein
MDQVSASLTCLSKKEVLGVFDAKGEMRSRPQEISLLSATLGRKSILTWSQIMIKMPIAIATAAAVDFFVCATGVGTIGLEPDLNTLQRMT